MTEVPAYNRRQRSATCRVCDGPLRFYPTPLFDEAAMVAEEETEGRWVHLDVRDWLTNPHVPDPDEDEA